MSIGGETPPASLLEQGAGSALRLYAEQSGVEALLTGELHQGQMRTFASLEFLTEFGAEAETSSFNLRGDDGDSILIKAVHRAADLLATEFAVASGSAGLITLKIAGVEDVAGYAALMGYLNRLEYLSAVHVVAAATEHLELAVETPAGPERLVALFEADGRLELGSDLPPTDFETFLRWQG